MLGFSNDPRQTLVSLHDMLTGWQSIRGRRRMRHVEYPAPDSGPPAASMHTAPVSGTPPIPGSTVIGFHKLGDRMVPIYGDPTEVPEPAANATQPSRETEVPTPPAPPPSAATSPGDGPQAAPPEATLHTQQTPPPAQMPSPPLPPDFTPAAVAASAPRRTAPPVLDLPPPTSPLLVRTDEQAAMLERVFAEHRAELARQSDAQQAQHAAVMHAILAQHRLAQAEADAQHRQQLADLLSQRRDERQGASEAMKEHELAVVQLREILAEQASAQHAEHVRVADKIEAITDMVGMVGETVHRVAAAAFAPPLAPTEQAAKPAAKSTNPPPTQPEPARVQEPPRPATTAAQSPPPIRTAPTCASAAPRGPDFGPAAPSILALADSHGSTTPAAMTPRQQRAEQDARERRRLDDAVASFDDDATDPDEVPHG